MRSPQTVSERATRPEPQGPMTLNHSCGPPASPGPGPRPARAAPRAASCPSPPNPKNKQLQSGPSKPHGRAGQRPQIQDPTAHVHSGGPPASPGPGPDRKSVV